MATIELHNPADTRELVSSYQAEDPARVGIACDRAAEASEAWARTPGPRRAAHLYRASVLLDERAEQIATSITREEGKLYADALGEARRAAAILRFHAGEAERTTGEFGDASDPGAIAFTRRRPLGVVGIITPWNFPIAIPAWKTAPALAAGNTVVIKPASRAPGGTAALVQALADAGLPEGVLACVIGGAAVGQAIANDDRVRAVTFTGSNAVGEALRNQVQNRGARFQGELGGNNPLIVLADANLDYAASLAAGGAFGASGQKCTATRRVIVEESAYHALLGKFAATAERLVVGPGLSEGVDVPPLVDRDAQNEVLAAIAHARRTGARLVAGGGSGPDEHGCYVDPTVIADVGPGTPLIDDEVFGPVCAVIPARDAAQAAELANSTPYGLSASIVTNDLSHALEFIRSVDAGMVHVNRPTPGADPHLPFGGVKGSTGSGYREQGRVAIEFFTESQTVYIQPQPPADRD